jgi:hypothetical protein
MDRMVNVVIPGFVSGCSAWITGSSLVVVDGGDQIAA